MSSIGLPIRVTLSAVLLVAAASDLRTRRIPNWLTLPAIPVGVTAQAVYGDGLWAGLAGFGVALGAFFLLFAVGAMGAGDVKLFAAVGAFLGIRHLLPVFVMIGLAGGVAAVIVALRAGALSRVLRNTAAIAASLFAGRWDELRRRSDLNQPGAIRLPYGAAIAVGALLYLWFGQ
jgi:prepilin peptidase CpaA